MRVFLDACVLFPSLVRGIVLGAAEQGLFRPAWTPRVLEEWRIAAAAKQGPKAEARATEVAAAMRAAFPAGEVPTPDESPDLTLPDPADIHVLTGAAAAGADILLTFNLRDFPARTAARLGIEVRHPDGFLWELLCLDRQAMTRTVSTAFDNATVPPDRAWAALKRARLPRLGKAWQALSG